jgi:5'-nucleotidase
MMRILISNDDGIRADGIRALAFALCKQHDVYVVAPDQERSAQGHALTLHQPLRADDYTKSFHKSGIMVKQALAVSGTPSDCVKLAITTLLNDTPPDVVVSGINHGPNLGGDVVYSGTVSAALEAAMNNIPAIATSAFNGHLDICDFRDAADYIGLHLDKLLDLMGHSSDKIVLNVNTPAVDSQHYNGLKLCKLGLRMYTDFYEERKDPRGDTYYWLAGEMVNRDVDPEEDIEAIRNNYVTVTPIHADLTDEVVYESLKDRL